MVKVEVIEQFYDKENDLELRTKGTVFEVSEERAQTLISLGHVKMVEEKSKRKSKTKDTEEG